MSQTKTTNKFTTEDAIEHLKKVNDLLEFYLGDRNDESCKNMIRNNRLVGRLMIDLADEKFNGRKKFKQRFLRFFGATKEKLEQENKELKIELKKQEVKND